MKKTFTIIALFCAIFSFAQHKVSEHVATLVKQKTAFKKYAPLTAGNTTLNGDNVVKDAQYAVLNTAMVNEIATAKHDAIELDIPYHDKVVTVQLYRVELLAEGFHLDTDKSKNARFERGAHYRGIVKGEYTSIVSFNFFGDSMSGIVSNEGIGNLVIGKMIGDGNTSEYIIYSDSDLLITPNYRCSTEDPDHNHDHGQNTNRDSNGVQSNRCVTMYFEVDYDIFQQNGSNLTQTNNWMSSVFNNVQTLYANDGITTSLRSVFVWTTPDPYSGGSSIEYREQFNQVRPVFDGDLGQLVGIDPGGLGGIAATISGICSQANYSYSDVDFNFAAVPTFSWTVQVITHELGHLMGSPHTHGCYWNGNSTAIDGCGTQAGFQEGNCTQGPIPSSQGTIMSYCHLVPGVGINFNNGFGPQPAARILNHVESSACLSTDCINTCINTITAFNVTTTTNSATIAWNDINGNGPWQYSLVSANSGFTNWQTINTASVTLTNLNANTYYKIGVRKICQSGFTTVEQTLFITDADYCSGVSFTDPGGTGNYGNNQRFTRTIRPTVPGANIRLTFTSFNLEEGFDYLYVYEGSDTSAPLLEMLTGNIGSFILESAAADGSFTLEFVSDQEVTASGWNATISCANLSTKEISFADFRYYPNPTNGILTVTSGEVMEQVAVYNVAGQLLLDKAINNTETTLDLSAFSEGVYFFKVTGGNKEANFRVVKQN